MNIQNELFRDCVSEAAILFSSHWIELYGKFENRTNNDGIVDLEAQNRFAYFTVRDEYNSLTGHAGFIIINSPIHGCVMALDAFYYMKPEHRGTLDISKLLRFSAEYLMSHDVDRVVVSMMMEKDISPIIKLAGFVKSGETFIYQRR